MADTLVAMGAPADAGLDAGTPDAGLESTGVDTPSTQVETPEGAATAEGEQAAPVKAEPAIVDGKLSQTALATLTKIKAENPQLARALHDALFGQHRFMQAVPGGLKEVQALKQTVEQLGGETGIQDLQKETEGWRDFDNLYTAGDPKVLEFLTETPEASAAFLQIAPAAFEKFRSLNPEGYSAYVAKVFQADLYQAQIPLMLQRLGDFLPADNPRAVEIYQAISAYIERISGLAQKQVNAPAAAKAPADDKRAQELTAREQKLTRQEWRGEAESRHTALFQQAWKQAVGDRKLTDMQQTTIRELYGLKLQAILKGKPDFDKNLERFFQSGQRENFAKYMSSAYQDAVPRALRAAVAQAGIGGKPGPAANGAPAKGPLVPPVRPGAGKPAAGVTALNAKPKMELVDRNQTSTDDWLAGRAVLKSGARVTWKR